MLLTKSSWTLKRSKDLPLIFFFFLFWLVLLLHSNSDAPCLVGMSNGRRRQGTPDTRKGQWDMGAEEPATHSWVRPSRLLQDYFRGQCEGYRPNMAKRPNELSKRREHPWGYQKLMNWVEDMGCQEEESKGLWAQQTRGRVAQTYECRQLKSEGPKVAPCGEVTSS